MSLCTFAKERKDVSYFNF